MLYMHMLHVLFTCAVAVVADAVYAYAAGVVHMCCCCSCWCCLYICCRCCSYMLLLYSSCWCCVCICVKGNFFHIMNPWPLTNWLNYFRIRLQFHLVDTGLSFTQRCPGQSNFLALKSQCHKICNPIFSSLKFFLGPFWTGQNRFVNFFKNVLNCKCKMNNYE